MTDGAGGEGGDFGALEILTEVIFRIVKWILANILSIIFCIP